MKEMERRPEGPRADFFSQLFTEYTSTANGVTPRSISGSPRCLAPGCLRAALEAVPLASVHGDGGMIGKPRWLTSDTRGNHLSHQK